VTARPITRRMATPRRLVAPGPLGVLAALGALAALALPAAAAADTSVSISDTGYKPAVVTIEQGDVVTWITDGKGDHTQGSRLSARDRLARASSVSSKERPHAYSTTPASTWNIEGLAPGLSPNRTAFRSPTGDLSAKACVHTAK
jgi:plastocyanin